MSEEKQPTMYCPECGLLLYASGACYNSKERSGYQCYCEVCGIWWTQGLDGNYYKDKFLTAVASQSLQVTGGTINIEVEPLGIQKGSTCPKCGFDQIEAYILRYQDGSETMIFSCLKCGWDCGYSRKEADVVEERKLPIRRNPPWHRTKQSSVA